MMSLTKIATVAAFALVSSQALAQSSFDDRILGSLPNRFEALAGGNNTPTGNVVVLNPTERRVNGVREVLIRNNWMIAPND